MNQGIFSVFYTKDYSLASLDPAPKTNVLLLTTNTEVSIAPKPHKSKESAPSKPLVNGHQTPNGKIVTDDEKASSASQIVASQVLRVLPSRLMPNLKFPEHNGSELLAFVSTRALTQLLGSESSDGSPNFDYFYQGNFTRLAPPPDPSSSSSHPPPEPSTRILNPGAKGESDTSSKVQPGFGDIYIGSSEQIPGGHIVYFALPEGLEEWDLVRCLPFLHLT